MAKTEVVIIGADDNGFVIKNILAFNKNNSIVGFLDDKKEGKHILGKVSDFPKYQKRGCRFFVSIGNNIQRKNIFLKLKMSKAKLINAIHPSAVIEAGVKLGENVMIGAQSYVNIRSHIGDNTFINNGCTVEHDNYIGEHCHLAPSVATGGGVKVGDETLIGLNSTIRDQARIGKGALIGMGSVVTKDIPAGVVAFGCPARVIRKK